MTKSKKLTDQEKELFGPMLCQVWEAIGYDVEMANGGKTPSPRIITEVVCDANHPETYGGMTRDQAARLSECYFHRDTQRWLRQTLNY